MNHQFHNSLFGHLYKPNYKEEHSAYQNFINYINSKKDPFLQIGFRKNRSNYPVRSSIKAKILSKSERLFQFREIIKDYNITIREFRSKNTKSKDLNVSNDINQSHTRMTRNINHQNFKRSSSESLFSSYLNQIHLSKLPLMNNSQFNKTKKINNSYFDLNKLSIFKKPNEQMPNDDNDFLKQYNLFLRNTINKKPIKIANKMRLLIHSIIN